MGLLKSFLRCKCFFLCFFFSLINGHDAESQSLQEGPPGCESEAPRAVSHAARMPVQKDSSDVRLFPLPSLFKKEVDPIEDRKSVV